MTFLVAGAPAAYADGTSLNASGDQATQLGTTGSSAGSQLANPTSAGSSSTTSTQSEGSVTFAPANTQPQPSAAPGDQQTSQAASETTTEGGQDQANPTSTQGDTGATEPGPTGAQPDATTSNTTTQQIWQVQTLGCSAHCQGASQTQSAQQLNTTVQAAGWTPSNTDTGSGSAPVSGSALASDTSGGSANVTQIQVGCMSHCFGTTTTTGAAQPAQQDPDQPIASATPPVLPYLDPVGGSPQNVVDQSSYQSQDGVGSVGSQSQIASQASTTLNGVPLDWLDSLSSLTSSSLSSFSLSDLLSGGSDATSPASGSTSPTGDSSEPTGDPSSQPDGTAASGMGQIVDQLEQGIWQIQVGCLIFCVDTSQQQQAAESDSTIWVLPATASPDTGIAASPTQTYQLIWQLQIGCLFWCWDAVESQTATISSSITTLDPTVPPPQTGPPSAPSPSPSSTGASSPGTATPPASTVGVQQAPPATPPITSASGPTTIGPPPPGRTLGSDQEMVLVSSPQPVKKPAHEVVLQPSAEKVSTSSTSAGATPVAIVGGPGPTAALAAASMVRHTEHKRDSPHTGSSSPTISTLSAHGGSGDLVIALLAVVFLGALGWAIRAEVRAAQNRLDA